MGAQSSVEQNGTSARSAAKGAKAAKKAARKADSKAAKTAGKGKKAVSKVVKKAAAGKKAGKKADTKKADAKKNDAKKAPGKKVAGKKKGKKKHRVKGDPLLFAPLSEGERADALRILTADRRVATMTAVGRYRIITVDPLVVKPPHERANHRLAHVIVYDYAADRSISAAVDLDRVEVAHLATAPIQPMLAREEEAAAIAIVLSSDEVQKQVGLGDVPQAALHYWSHREADISYRRRSAAVLLGQPSARPTLVAVVDLLDSQVVEVIPAEQW